MGRKESNQSNKQNFLYNVAMFLYTTVKRYEPDTMLSIHYSNSP